MPLPAPIKTFGTMQLDRLISENERETSQIAVPIHASILITSAGSNTPFSSSYPLGLQMIRVRPMR